MELTRSFFSLTGHKWYPLGQFSHTVSSALCRMTKQSYRLQHTSIIVCSPLCSLTKRRKWQFCMIFQKKKCKNPFSFLYKEPFRLSLFLSSNLKDKLLMFLKGKTAEAAFTLKCVSISQACWVTYKEEVGLCSSFCSPSFFWKHLWVVVKYWLKLTFKVETRKPFVNI